MSGASQPRSDSIQIDSRQRRDLANGRRRAASAEADRLALERGGPVREPVDGPFDMPSGDRSESAVSVSGARSSELRALSPGAYKSLENRLRRMADRQGLHLIKSRRRDPLAADHGKYMLVDGLTPDVATGGNWSLDLADVEQILLGTDPTARRINARDCPRCDTATYSLSGLVRGALVDERECPGCGHAFIATSTPPV